MKVLEAELEKSKMEANTAKDGKKAREQDLRIVLKHYEKLQKKYETLAKEFDDMFSKYYETLQKMDAMEKQMNVKVPPPQDIKEREDEELSQWNDEQGNAGTANPVENKQKGKAESVGVEVEAVSLGEVPPVEEDIEQETSVKKELLSDESSIDQLLQEMEDLKKSNNGLVETNDDEEVEKSIHESMEKNGMIAEVIDQPAEEEEEEEEKKEDRPTYGELVIQLKEAQVSSSWKHDEITKMVDELKASQDQIASLEKEKEKLISDLKIVRGHLLLAKKESMKVKEGQGSTTTNMRNTVAKNHKLQQEYEDLQSQYKEVQEQLTLAQKDARVREEEAKEARKRASTVHAQYKQLQVNHSEVQYRLSKLEQELKKNNKTPVTTTFGR
jgi:hypothetical protein